MNSRKAKLSEAEKIDSIVKELERIISQIHSLPNEIADDFLKCSQDHSPEIIKQSSNKSTIKRNIS